MQMLGIGLPELMVILILAVLVIGPDRLPQFAADLAKWIRQARVYANHLTKDFNEVVGELEKEAGATREDWKEIASVVTRNTGDVARELQKAASQLETEATIDGVTAAPPAINGRDPASLGEAFRRAQLESDRLNGITAAASEPAGPQAMPLAERDVEEPAEATVVGAEAAPTGEETPAEEQPWFEPSRPSRARRRSTN
jgi:Tat protein translocase TatB subunit